MREGALVRHLRGRHVLWLHGWAMGLLTLGAMLLATTLLRHAGVDALAWRYAIALGAGYGAYLLLVRVWAGMLVREEERDVPDPGLDLPWPDGGGGRGAHGGYERGGGGDFGGGGADASFELPADAGSALGDAASGALDAVSGADEGAIVVIPVLAVFAAVAAALLGGGGLLLAYFGTEALLAVAVELAFAWTAARTVVRVEREGWLLAAIRLTWKPLLGALACGVLLGALIDHFAPQADTLPEAVRLWRGR
ncbi:MAG: hypothetical protein QM772_12450 [Ottowia sp.]|uniref:hypothetical protein n=1 Tax=Ottowia sp. TaxID=1898956 RepID=UPI0039E5074E